MRLLLQFPTCFALGLLVAVRLVLGPMFLGEFGLIDALLLSGRPLAQQALRLLPEPLRGGPANAPQLRAVQSFPQLCAALGQAGAMLALGFMRLWYRA
ncbi:hypothetical protein I0E98_12740 [Pseudomonas lalucatii]|nr:hypothetical protein [Pseudomonas lalucatii]